MRLFVYIAMLGGYFGGLQAGNSFTPLLPTDIY
jgi:hypothetical protein